MNEDMKIINSILNKVKKRIAPDRKIIKDVDAVVQRINAALIKNNIDAECVKGGSIGKNTFLKNDHDVDLFVRFALKYKGQDISTILEDILRKAFPRLKISRIHGSRDYYQFQKKLYFEIIPVLKIHKTDLLESENVTDMSPEHVHWVDSYTKNNPELTDEIRLAKQFMKANNVYGAESYINGFSGHIVDILIIHYGSFCSLIKKFSSIDAFSKDHPLIIDHEEQLKNPLKQLNPSKISPLIIIDPIDKYRNAAAALNFEKIEQFITACKNFLETPSEDFFIIKKFDLNKEIKESAKNLNQKTKTVIIEAVAHQSSKDIMGTKLLKVHEDIVKQLTMNDFNILNSRWHFDGRDSSLSILVFPGEKLSETTEQTGPPLSSNIDVENFKSKHSKTYMRGNRIFANINRKYILPELYIKDLMTKDFIRSRVKKIVIKDIIIK